MKIGKIYKDVLNESSGYDYGCIMLYLDPPKEWWGSVTSKIDKDDLYEPSGERDYGIQKQSKAHVTILYGLNENVLDSEINDRVKMIEPVEITLKNISLFENEEYDVLKFDVTSEQLDRYNKLFSELPHTSLYPDYHPHCTIAYLKPGKGKKYVETLKGDDVLKVICKKIVYSKTNGDELVYNLD